MRLLTPKFHRWALWVSVLLIPIALGIAVMAQAPGTPTANGLFSGLFSSYVPWENASSAVGNAGANVAAVSGMLWDGAAEQLPSQANAANATAGTGVPAAGNMGWDSGGSLWRRLLANSSGNLIVSTTGTTTTAGGLTNNNAVPSTNNIGALSVLANAAAPTWTEGDLVTASADLSGRQRVLTTASTTGTPGDAFSAPGAIPQTQSFPQLWNGATNDRIYSANAAANTTGTGVPASGLLVYDNTNWQRLSSASVGGGKGAIVAIGGTGGSIAQIANQAADSYANTNASVATVPYTALYRGDGTWDRQRTPVKFFTAQATASGDTAVWTPAGGKKFRLMRYQIEVTDNATQTAAGVITVLLRDATTATAFAHDVYVPSAAIDTNGQLYTSGWQDLGNGFLSAAANNVLNVNLSAALLTGNVRVRVAGTEE